MSKWFFAALAMLVGLGSPAAFAQEGQEARFAFVIGNDSYQNAPMPTAANDAGLVADTLKSAGFDVTGARNLDQDTLRASYREFLEKVAAAGSDAVAFIYISGSGVQFQGEDYLVPGGAELARESDIPLDAVRLTDLTKPLAALSAKAKIAVFDVAYPAPLATASGLALIEPDPGMLIAMNAAPGMLGPTSTESYGAYAQALAEMIQTPGLPIADIFDQVRLRVATLTKGAEVPWDESRIEQPFVFFAAGSGAPPASVTDADIVARRTRPIRDFPADQAYAAALERDTLAGYTDFLAAYPTGPYTKTIRGLLAARREALTWRHTIDVGTPQAYWSYLRRYSRGPHAAEAEEILSRLAAAEQPPADFAAIQYDVPPPPAYEEAYFDADEPVFYDPAAAPPPVPVIFLPPPPPWWSPPPPPRIERDDVYFLPEFEHHEEHPAWERPPSYVMAPALPQSEHGAPPGERISPYVAIPAALAVGITAGRLLKGKQSGPQSAHLPGGSPPSSPILLPPVTAPPGPRHGEPQSRGLPPQVPGGQPLPGAAGHNLPSSNPSAALPSPGTIPNNALPGSEHGAPRNKEVPVQVPGGQPLPGATGHNPPTGRPSAGLPPPGVTPQNTTPSGHLAPGHELPSVTPNTEPATGTAPNVGRTEPRLAEPSPAPHAEPSPHPQLQQHNLEPETRRNEPTHGGAPQPPPQARIVQPPAQPHLDRPAPPPTPPHVTQQPEQAHQVPQHNAEPSTQHEQGQHEHGQPACGHPGQPPSR